MKKNKKSKEFLDQLKRIPIIQVACEKTGVSRNSVYRWRNEDEDFKKEMETALSEGEALVNDMSESQVLTLIKEKNFPAISFWLKHRHPKYKTRVEIEGSVDVVKELSSEQEELVRKAFELSGIKTKKYGKK